MSSIKTACIDIFLHCDEATRKGVLIHRANRQDKEFHFQDWFGDRLNTLMVPYDPPARNSYPDFRLVQVAEGYEIKGLAYPGREANYDANSQVPRGFHNGRTIFYLFGRYPAGVVDDDYPVIDFVMCHGDFLNADHTYVHKNKHIRGFGTYGDILIRDRKMYVAPTPFALTEGTTGQRTLILPKVFAESEKLEPVGELLRIEAEQLVVGYKFDLRTNNLEPEYAKNPDASREHSFLAYRALGSDGPSVKMKASSNDLIVASDEE